MKNPADIPRMLTWPGPPEIREAVRAVKGDDWCKSYLDQCGWSPATKTVTAAHSFAYRQMQSQASGALASIGLKLADPNSQAYRQRAA